MEVINLVRSKLPLSSEFVRGQRQHLEGPVAHLNELTLKLKMQIEPMVKIMGNRDKWPMAIHPGDFDERTNSALLQLYGNPLARI